LEALSRDTLSDGLGTAGGSISHSTGKQKKVNENINERYIGPTAIFPITEYDFGLLVVDCERGEVLDGLNAKSTNKHNIFELLERIGKSRP